MFGGGGGISLPTGGPLDDARRDELDAQVNANIGKLVTLMRAARTDPAKAAECLLALHRGRHKHYEFADIADLMSYGNMLALKKLARTGCITKTEEAFVDEHPLVLEMITFGKLLESFALEEHERKLAESALHFPAFFARQPKPSPSKGA